MSTATAKPVHGPVITERMVTGAITILDKHLAADVPLDEIERIARDILREALTNPDRCGNCGGSLANVKAGASWCSPACKMAAYRHRAQSQNRHQRAARRPGGLQVSLGRGITELEAYFVVAGVHPQDKARAVAERVLRRALPARQRRRARATS